MSSFDVRVFAIRRRPGRKAFEVRWRVAGRNRSRSFMTRALADSYRAELIRAARRGQAFDPATGEPAAWVTPEPVTVTWYQHAAAYAEMKWPRLAAAFPGQPGRRASHDHPAADPGNRPQAARRRRCAPRLYGHAFNPRGGDPARRIRAPPAHWPGWSGPRCRSASLSDPAVIRAALDGLCARLDGSPAAANTISRKRAVFHGALGYAVELGCCPPTPSAWCAGTHPSRRSRQPGYVSPAPHRSGRSWTRSPASGRNWPRSSAACTTRHCAPKKPSRCAATTSSCPAHGRGDDHPHRRLPAHRDRLDQHRHRRTSLAVSSTGPTATIRVVPIPPVLAAMLRQHLRHLRHRAGRAAVPRHPRRACSASRSTAAPGTPPATPPSARNWPPRRSPAAPTTCGTPPCPCG